MKRNEWVPCNTLRLPREGARGTGKRGRHPVWVLEKQKDEERGNRRAGRQVLGRGSPQCFPAASRPIGIEAFYHAVILTVQTSYCKKWHRECPEKRRTPRVPENGAAVSARVPAGVSLEYGETFPGGNPGPAECRRSRPRGLPGYPYRLLKCCGRLHTPSRTGAARFLLAAFFQRRIVSATFNRQEWLWIPTKRPSKARRASIAC
mgnify:FL=1